MRSLIQATPAYELSIDITTSAHGHTRPRTSWFVLLGAPPRPVARGEAKNFLVLASTKV